MKALLIRFTDTDVGEWDGGGISWLITEMVLGSDEQQQSFLKTTRRS